MTLLGGAAPVIALLTLFSGACGHPDPPEWSAFETTGSSWPAPKRASTPSLVILLDSSASMAGYTSASGDSAFSRTLHELRNAATLVSPALSVSVRRVDRNVGPAMGETTLATASISKTFFDGAETDVAGALAAVAAPGAAPARISVLVTDGVQSTTSSGAGGPCVAGSDPICVRTKAIELLEKGWGICVLGVRSAFDGRIYSEVRAASGAPSVVTYKTTPSRPGGYRPFYLWVLSPEPAVIAPFVETLRERLGTFTRADGVRIFTLGIPLTSAPPTVDVSLAGEAKELIDERVEAREGGSPRVTMQVEVGKAGSSLPVVFGATLPFTRTALGSDTPKGLASALKWTVSSVASSGKGESTRQKAPELVIRDRSVDANGKVLLNATVRWPAATGSPSWALYRLQAHLDPEARGPEWVRDWSTDLDVTPDAGNRTLFLESALAGLRRHALEAETKRAKGNRSPVAEVLVRVGPR